MAVDPVEFAQALIRAKSVTPAGAEAFDLLEATLAAAGFEVARPTFSAEGTASVENLFATRGTGRHFALVGHVDVVPPGPQSAWRHGAFEGVIESGVLFGRGAQDMKGAVAAMVSAACDWADETPAEGAGRLSLLMTGDEEGPAINGMRPLCEMVAEAVPLDGALVGEPTSRKRLGDTMKVGRRGSLSAEVRVQGRQGHVAYPEAADNPVRTLIAIGRELSRPLDEGTPQFAPSNLEIVSIDVGNPAWNVIPETGSLRFNIRLNDRWTLAKLKDVIAARVMRAAPTARVEIVWQAGSAAFLTEGGALIETVQRAVEGVTGIRPEPTTGGGTSDARFLKDHCPVVEFGAVGDAMHQINERTPVADLAQLQAIYRATIDMFYRA